MVGEIPVKSKPKNAPRWRLKHVKINFSQDIYVSVIGGFDWKNGDIQLEIYKEVFIDLLYFVNYILEVVEG